MLRLVGAKDAYIARAFVRRFTLRAGGGAAGMEEAKKVGQTTADYSGEYGFVDTYSYWPITHMVAPTEEALACDACHQRNGILASLEGGYLPGRDKVEILDQLGWLLVVGTLGGVGVHGLGRLVSSRRRRKG